MSTQDQTVTAAPLSGHGHGHDHRDDLRVVTVFNCKTNETARFAVPPQLSLARVWQMAYAELGEVRGENDIFETRAGQPLTDHLEQSVEYIAEHIDPCLEFQIHGEQGGA